MKRTNGVIALYLTLVFAGGVAVGGFGHHMWTAKTVSATTKKKSPEDYRKAYMAEMRQRLQLTDEQATQVEKVLDRTRERYREFRERTRPEMEQIQKDQTTDVKSLLSAKQAAEYDKMRAEREEQRRKGDRRAD